jgi:hypothetical protein
MIARADAAMRSMSAPWWKARGAALCLLPLAACADTPRAPANFEECVARGNPAMVSHPRQCRDDASGTHFTEQLIGDARRD